MLSRRRGPQRSAHTLRRRHISLADRPHERDPASSPYVRALTLDHTPRLILGTMAECCCPEASAAGEPVACSVCQTVSKPVDTLTVKALLTVSALTQFAPAEYRFCPSAGCNVVYFSKCGPTFSKRDVRAPVWQKEPVGRRTVCYCFGESEGDIAEEIERTGESLAVCRVRAHIAAGRCACEVRNPKGTCCLGDVTTAVERMQQIARTGAMQR